MSASEAEDYVDERFFRQPKRSSYGPETMNTVMKYWSKRTGIFGGSGIYILEFYWQDELDQPQITTRDEICRIYKDLTRLSLARSEAYKDVRPFFLSKIFKDDSTWKEVWTWDHDCSYRFRRIMAHLNETCADIAALERKSQLPVEWTQYAGPVPNPTNRAPNAPQLMTTYPFLLCREAQKLLDTLTVPLELQLGQVVGRICLEAKPDAAFGIGKVAEEAAKGREKEVEAKKERWRGWLTDLLQRKAEREAESLPPYPASLPSYDDASADLPPREAAVPLGVTQTAAEELLDTLPSLRHAQSKFRLMSFKKDLASLEQDSSIATWASVLASTEDYVCVSRIADERLKALWQDLYESKTWTETVSETGDSA